MISDDWLNAFEDEAVKTSSEQMQLLFGKILAGEIMRPQSFSIKTIKAMAQLDNVAAVLFQRLCSLAISHRIPDHNIILDARVVSMGGYAGQNSLIRYGIGFRELIILNEYGLIISDFNSYYDYGLAVVVQDRPVLPITYGRTTWVLVPNSEYNMNKELLMHGVKLSIVGQELLPIVEAEQDENYSVSLKQFFHDMGLVMTAIG